MFTRAQCPSRIDGYAPIREYAVIGNKRIAGLVALDGSLDWLSVPSMAGPSMFAALLDCARGGRFQLAPAGEFTAERRYLEDTNVLETTFYTGEGTVRVTDAVSRPIARGLLWNQVIRRIDGMAGRVPMAWRVAPRFDYGASPVAPTRIADVPVFLHGPDAVAVEAFGAGRPEAEGCDVHGAFEARQGEVALLALSAFHAEPLTFSSRDHLLQRLDATVARWREWMRTCAYDGPWSEAVRRSALALDLLVDEETGAIAAAATMGLPERIGGSRNYDYRYGWLRDINLTLEAMRRLGFRDQVHTSLGWMLKTARRTHPRLRPMYRLSGSVRLPDAELPLAGYRHSRPVVLGNGAQDQLQLGNYGDMFDMTLHYVRDGGALAPAQATQLAEAADFLSRIWRLPEASIWELSEERLYTQGKLASWLALTHAAELADLGQLPAATAGTWRREAAAVRAFVAERCFSPRLNSYTRAPDGEELDAGVLLAARGSFLLDDRARLNGTIDAIRSRLGAGGPLLYRYTGMHEHEGAFLACSFWLVEVLVAAGRLEEAVEAMDALVTLSNDVGLYSEQIDPSTGEFLGNLPQALTHLALVNAASACAERLRRPASEAARASAG